MIKQGIRERRTSKNNRRKEKEEKDGENEGN